MYVAINIVNAGVGSSHITDGIPLASKGSPTSAAPSKGKTADYPFDGSKDMTTADVVIQSRDGTRFFVHQAILSVASPVFRAYFTRTEGKARLKQDRRYFDLPEHSDVLDHLFRMIYPVENRAISKLPLVLDVWVTAHKYKMSVTEKALAERIRAMLGHGNELSVYAAACMMADEELARKAAEAWVKNTGPNVRTTKYLFFECISSANFVYVPRMVVCSAGAYYRLLRYILRCADPLGSGTAESGHTFVTTPSYPKSSSSSDAKAASPVSKTKAEEELSTLPSPDVIIRSKEGCGIFAHKLLLQLAGAASLMNEAAFNDPDDPSTAPLPVHPTSLSTPVLKKLILLSYPSTIYDVHDIALSEIAPLVVAARRSAFKLIKHEAILKERLSSLTTKEPLRTYFVAEQLGWEDIAEQAARQTTGMNIEELYVPEMEEVSAAAYYKLVKFHHQCQLAVLRTDADYKPSEHPTLRPVRLSILSLLGMQSPFKTVPVALAAQVQLDRTQTRTADGTQQSPRRWSEWPMMEHKMETIADEVSLRKGAIQRALSAVGVMDHPPSQLLNLVTQVHLEKKTQDGVAK